MKLILRQSDTVSDFIKTGGGKATHLARLSQAGLPVPPWFCISCEAFQDFVQRNHLVPHLFPSQNLKQFAAQVETLFLSFPFPVGLRDEIIRTLGEMGLGHHFVAVRSSGLDEDSTDHSFAGQFSSFLYQ